MRLPVCCKNRADGDALRAENIDEIAFLVHCMIQDEIRENQVIIEICRTHLEKVGSDEAVVSDEEWPGDWIDKLWKWYFKIKRRQYIIDSDRREELRKVILK